MSNSNQVLRSINAATKRRFKESAKTIPSEIVQELKARALEAVESNEPHKATGGWIASPFYGKFEICGLLEIASKLLHKAQAEAFRAA